MWQGGGDPGSLALPRLLCCLSTAKLERLLYCPDGDLKARQEDSVQLLTNRLNGAVFLPSPPPGRSSVLPLRAVPPGLPAIAHALQLMIYLVCCVVSGHVRQRLLAAHLSPQRGLHPIRRLFRCICVKSRVLHPSYIHNQVTGLFTSCIHPQPISVSCNLDTSCVCVDSRICGGQEHICDVPCPNTI